VSHCLPTGASSPFWTDDYEAYLEWRQTKLWNEIKRVTGIMEAADLEEANEEEPLKLLIDPTVGFSRSRHRRSFLLSSGTDC
jgi:hypothetical protein